MERAHSTNEFTIYELLIIKKLSRRGYIGGRHTNETSVLKGFPKHERGNIKKALDSLIKKNIVIQKPTSYGREVSINPHYPEIEKIIEKSMKFDKEILKEKKREIDDEEMEIE